MSAAFMNVTGRLTPANYIKPINSFVAIKDLDLFQTKDLVNACLMSVVVKLNTLNGETVVIQRMGG